MCLPDVCPTRSDVLYSQRVESYGQNRSEAIIGARAWWQGHIYILHPCVYIYRYIYMYTYIYIYIYIWLLRAFRQPKSTLLCSAARCSCEMFWLKCWFGGSCQNMNWSPRKVSLSIFRPGSGGAWHRLIVSLLMVLELVDPKTMDLGSKLRIQKWIDVKILLWV